MSWIIGVMEYWSSNSPTILHSIDPVDFIQNDGFKKQTKSIN